MNPLEFILALPSSQRQLCLQWHERISDWPGVNCSIKYNIPFYHGRKNICYLNPLKDGQRVELAFLEGKKLSSLYHILDMRDRKSVAGFILNPLQEIPWDELVCIMQDALK